MKWTKPELKEIPLGMEVTAYVNMEKPVCSPSAPVRPARDARSN